MKANFVSSVNVEIALGTKVIINSKGGKKEFRLWGFRVTAKQG
jgi:hypothetical protein